MAPKFAYMKIIFDNILFFFFDFCLSVFLIKLLRNNYCFVRVLVNAVS